MTFKQAVDSFDVIDLRTVGSVPVKRMLLLVAFMGALSTSCGSEDEAQLKESAEGHGAVTATASPMATPTAAPGPADVFRAFVEAINDSDSAAAEALLAADATWQRGGQCPPGQCRGLDRLAQEIRRDVAAHHRIDILMIQADARTVAARVELRTDQTRAAGVERVIQNFDVKVSDGRIVAVAVTNDLTDEITAAFVAQRRGQ